MCYCPICNDYYGYEYYSCPNKDCKFIKIFIKLKGIKKLKAILENSEYNDRYIASLKQKP